ncbi:MAG TPA: sterol desaturase family protein [Bacteroidia bacterium]|nr:sterol desaturase family protein [Bacteroidia bacterium]
MPKVTPYIIYAIPVFFILIGVEIWIARRRNQQVYRLNDAIANISCGVAQQVFSVLIRGVLLLGYLYLYENHKLLTLGADQWWVWVLCFIGVDFFYYWFHRYAHEISFMWGGHIVHHQSEEYNLSVALRQGAFQGLSSWVFYLPLAWIGFDPVVFLVVSQFQTLYQFWIHTRLIGKMWAPFEYVFNTPSHHRVHHGVNPKYIDKNHGGTLIIWDRMFGTFQAEEEEVVYGVTKPLASWNPVWANFDYFYDLGKLIIRCQNFPDVIRAIVKGPGWRPAYLGGPQKPQPVTTKSFRKFDTAIPKGLGRYVLVQYVVVILCVSGFLMLSGKLREAYAHDGLLLAFAIAGCASLIYLSIVSMGNLTAAKAVSFYYELMRLGFLVALAAFFASGSPWFLPVVGGTVAYLLGSLAWLSRFGENLQHQPTEAKG